jgi:hypothetical protein
MSKITIVLLALFFCLSLSQKPSGKIISFALDSQGLFATLTVPDALQKKFRLPLPKPGRDECLTPSKCFSARLIFFF